MPYNPVQDFTLITALVSVPTVLVIHPGVPASNLQEFIAFTKARPGQVNFGSAGIGSIHHLTMAILELESGIKVLHVPYKGDSLPRQTLKPPCGDSSAGVRQAVSDIR